ncbi:MAG: hypothetical protein U5S82_18230 [Gammaproteobacteria bacterium]|nr:hypothetical protein [Gammaproteobacteria bacterium]
MSHPRIIHAGGGLAAVLVVGLALSLVAPPAAAWGYGYGHHYGRHYSPYYGGHRYGLYRSHRRHGYRSYSPSYRYRSHVGLRDYGTTTTTSRDTTDISSSNYDSNDETNTVVQGGDGWSRLAAGDARGALRSFGLAAEAAPDSGQPKAGYAVAAAATGDLSRGVWAMRRAFRIDADGLHYLEVDDELRPRLEEVLAAYSPVEGQDEAFMNAALYYILEAPDSATEALERLKAFGDDSEAAQNLEALIAELVRERGAAPADAPLSVEPAPAPG